MNTPENDSEKLDAELRAIARAAAELPPLSPSRDLWSGIEARIEAPVVALPVRHESPATPVAARHSWRRLAVAASLLVAATAGVTYTLMKQSATRDTAASGDSLAVESNLPASGSGLPAGGVQAASLTAAEQNTEQLFDREIGAMRKIMDERRKDLDPATISVLEKNLKLIDAAIAESKAALAKDPASAFLMDRLTHAYDDKLQLLRGVASIPSHG
jgi:hypothetical protein